MTFKKEDQEAVIKQAAEIFAQAKNALNKLDEYGDEHQTIKNEIILNLDNLSNNLVEAYNDGGINTKTFKNMTNKTKKYITDMVNIKWSFNNPDKIEWRAERNEKPGTSIWLAKRCYNDYVNFVTHANKASKNMTGLEFAAGLVVGTALILATCVFFSMVKVGAIILPQVMGPLMLGVGLAMLVASAGTGYLTAKALGGVRRLIEDTSQRRREKEDSNQTIQKAEANMAKIADCGRQLFFKDPPCTSSSSRATAAESSNGYEPVSQSM